MCPTFKRNKFENTSPSEAFENFEKNYKELVRHNKE
jgi:hypothetical protein